MQKVIKITPKILGRLLNEEYNVENYEGWIAEADHSTGSYDGEKGAMIDYEITLYNPEGKAVYEAIDGYYTGPTGDIFHNDITFTLIEEIKEESELLTKVVVYYGGERNGDGSCSLRWFLTEQESQIFDTEGEGCECTGNVETFIGSDIYNEALENKTT